VPVISIAAAMVVHLILSAGEAPVIITGLWGT
jgi:hypothetical protein